MANDRLNELKTRWVQINALRKHYSDFRDFYRDCSVDLLGFEPSAMQYDIANYIAMSDLYSMVQAQRGEAKTTITGCYAVWRLIHNPRETVLIFSAGGKMAKQISTWCIQIITGMAQLSCLVCDRSYPGARASVEAYDVHFLLKGPDKSPSISCQGITGFSQGFRASLLIADDIESKKNSLTVAMRDTLREQTRDFSSINRSGDILYLGTPQSNESIYNDLPSRGFQVRIWPGRFPTEEEELNYGPHLAPFITKQMEADPSLRHGGGPTGDRGQPTDPIMMSEEMLTKKEVDSGKAYFDLQFMLNTALTDYERFPLKASELMIYSFDNDECPGKFVWTNDITCEVPIPTGSLVRTKIYRPAKVHSEFFPYSHKLLAVDPAGGGQNGDETGVAVIYACNGYFILKYVGGVPGGTQRPKLIKLMELAVKYGCTTTLIEQNFGHGAYAEAYRAICIEHEVKMKIEEVFATGQKELRIIDTLEPVIGAHKLLVDQSALQDDVVSTEKYPVERRQSYQFLHQLVHITRDKGSLLHEDRLDAFTHGVRHLVNLIKINADEAVGQKLLRKFKDFAQCPVTGMWRLAHRMDNGGAIPNTIKANVMDKYKR